MYGYTGKMLFVNLSNGEIEVKELSQEIAKNFIGGAGLGAKILYDEMPPHTDPLGPDSMIGFVGGPLNNTSAFFGGRYTVVCKSPVYNGWNDSNSGGYFGPLMKKAGYDAIFVKGISEKPVYIFIDNGKVEIKDASKIWGLTVVAAENALKEEIGDNKIHAALIGPGGERLSLIAAVMHDSHRAAGRGGSGAVMGSKKLKAVVVRGNHQTEVADKEKLKALNKETLATMKGPKAGVLASLGTFGTGGGYTGFVVSGDGGVKNWGGSLADFPEESAAKISTRAYDEKYKVKRYACASCPLACGAFYNVPDGKWPLSHTARPEYETCSAFGGLLLNSNAEAVIKCSDLCNEYGLDVMSVGSTIAWAMECYENGLLTKENLDGVELVWGNANAIVEMTVKICKGEGCGAVLCKGSAYAAEKYGVGHEYLVVASGIEMPQHDSRFHPAYARTYKYDPSPGRHVQGGLAMSVPQDLKHQYNLHGYNDMMATFEVEIYSAAGLCRFAMNFQTPAQKLAAIEAVTGFSYPGMEATALGWRIHNIQHAFNLREGFRRKDYKFSQRMFKGKPPYEGPVSEINVDVELMSDCFFSAIGWDIVTLVPTKESLERIGGLENVINDLYPNG